VKTGYIVTHGKKLSNIPDPGMTPEGFIEVNALKNLVPKNPSIVLSGTGKRHIDVALALELEPTRYSSTIGDGNSLEVIDEKKVILLTSGIAVDPDKYTSLDDNSSAAKTLVASLPDNFVVCAGRPSMIMLGFADAKSAAVYKVIIVDNEIISIEEVVAAGVAEKGTV